MASPVADSYACQSGGTIAGGRFIQTISAPFVDGTPSVVSLAADFPDIDGSAVVLSVVSGSLPAGVTLDPVGRRLVYDGTAGVTTVNVTIQSKPTAPSLSFSNASGTIPVMAGIVFPKGAVTGPLGASDNGLRVVVRRTWNDGSVKHAVVCGTVDAATRVTFNTAPIAGTALTSANIQTAAPTAVVDLGALGSVSLDSLLASPSETWISTEKMVECHYRGQFGSTDVWAEFHVRLWAGGIMWVRAVVENSNRIRTSGTDRTLTGTVTIDGTVVTTYSATNLYRNTLHVHERWIGATQYDVVLVHDVAQIQRTKLTPNYGMATSISEAVLSGLPTSYSIGSRLLYSQSMGDGGYQDGIGILPKWDACYLVSGDTRAFRSVLAHGKAAFNYPILWREGSRMLIPTDYPTSNYGGANHGGTTSLITGVLTWEVAHHPSMGYMAYLLTGDALYADALLGLSATLFQILNTSYGGPGTLRRQYNDQTRSTAWFKRSLGQAASILPNSSTEKPVIGEWLANHINYFASVSIEDSAGSGSEIGYPITIGSYNSSQPLTIAPWQHNFWIGSMGYISDLDALSGADQAKLIALRDWMYRGITGLLGDGTGYCYSYASKYNLKMSSEVVPDYAIRTASQLYQTWAEVMTATNGAQSCGTALLGSGAESPSEGYYAYWGNILPAISYAVEHGAAGAVAAYARITEASNYSSLSNSAWSTIPLWGCTPRPAISSTGKVFSVEVAAPNTFFSTESTAGSYNSGTYTWTPGRGSDGRITQTSFDLLPTDGTWVEVAGTGFVSNVQPLLTAALPSYNDPGSGDLAAVLTAYNGFAHDIDGARAIAHGGGHNDTANNGIYPLDLKKMTWLIAKLPDMQTYWEAQYKTNPPNGTLTAETGANQSSFTIYPGARRYCIANPTTTTVGYDEFYDDAEPLASTRNPTSRHTYEAMVFADGKLMHGVRRMWEWTEATGAWTSKYPLGKNYTTHNQPGGGNTGEAVKGTWDEVNRRYLCTPTLIGAPGSGWAYYPDTGTWVLAPTGLLGGYPAYSSVFARRGREWCSFAIPSGTDYFPPVLRKHNLDTNSVTNLTLSGIVQTKCISAFHESASMAYVASLDKFFVLMPYDLNDLYTPTQTHPLVPMWIDPASLTITPETPVGAFPALTSTSLVKNKMFYIPQIKCLCLVHSATENIRLRRLP